MHAKSSVFGDYGLYRYNSIIVDSQIREEIKQNLRDSIFDYVSKFEYKNTQPLDLLIPKERKVRSVVGGLETSMGTRVWEPVAETIAKHNGFEIIDEKLLKPDPFPEELAIELPRIIALRESRDTWIPAEECKKRLRAVCARIDRSSLRYIRPPSGTGVDVRIRKNGKEYAFDTKTVQPNLGSIKSFNKQIMEWYAYALCKDPEIDITCRIAYPYNPYEDNFWNHTPNNSGVLEPGVDAVVENEFWDFLSGSTNTYAVIAGCLDELSDEGFGRELSALIEQIQ